MDIIQPDEQTNKNIAILLKWKKGNTLCTVTVLLLDV